MPQIQPAWMVERPWALQPVCCHTVFASSGVQIPFRALLLRTPLADRRVAEQEEAPTSRGRLPTLTGVSMQPQAHPHSASLLLTIIRVLKTGIQVVLVLIVILDVDAVLCAFLQ